MQPCLAALRTPTPDTVSACMYIQVCAYTCGHAYTHLDISCKAHMRYSYSVTQTQHTWICLYRHPHKVCLQKLWNKAARAVWVFPELISSGSRPHPHAAGLTLAL